MKRSSVNLRVHLQDCIEIEIPAHLLDTSPVSGHERRVAARCMNRANVPQLAHVVVKQTVVAPHSTIKSGIRSEVVNDQIHVTLENITGDPMPM